LCEFVFLENSLMRRPVIEKTEGNYRVPDIYSNRPTKGKFSNLFSEREEGKEQVFRVIRPQNTNVRCPSSHTPSYTV
jgi:arsenate reductase-like glutaredoxin family protein